ncbi:unnamed protein product [Spodoptera littoralis]|uniref:Uncharacterized protein n=1 Tax=Spodoptera littoralis TaxID=7109 RepID=A0A9P0IHK5_SPOLI|nr:unnamed protein product [Spodoptera littoralis]CAH1647895.1 unnamed protein product [Spodoptera littoralis]
MRKGDEYIASPSFTDELTDRLLRRNTMKALFHVGFL